MGARYLESAIRLSVAWRSFARRPGLAECSVRFRPELHALQVRRAPPSCLKDGGILHLDQRCVTRMVRFLVGIIARRVVATDHRPARLLGEIGPRTMQ